MDITQLRYFLRTAETLNYTRAAESLFITRQSLRQALGNLEQELGTPLFNNERNHLSLTGYGHYLAFSAAEVVSRFDAMVEDMDRLVVHGAELRVAFSVSLLTFLLKGVEQALKRFQAKFPRLRLESLFLTSDEVIDAALRGEIDCGCVLQMPCRREGCEVRTLRGYPAAVSFGEGMALCGRKRVSPEELAGVPLVGMGSLDRIAVPLWEDCRREGIALDYQVVPNTIDAFYHVQHSRCAGLDVACSPNLPDVKTSLFSDYSWELALLCPKSSPNQGMARLFCNFLAEWYNSQE